MRDLRARIEDDFLEIGQELATLNDPQVIEAMGYDDFAAVCTDALGMSVAKARQLIAVTTRLAPQLGLVEVEVDVGQEPLFPSV